ncbi:MAG: hypothetical protein AB7S36_19035, partial [Planctomycetota bacterium]
MKKVNLFSKPFLDRAPEPPMAPMAPPRAQMSNMMVQQQVMREVQEETSMNIAYDMDEADDRMDLQSNVSSSRGSLFGGFSGKSQGILPVKMEVPNIGRTLNFEQLIVLSEFATMTARYRKPLRFGFLPM